MESDIGDHETCYIVYEPKGLGLFRNEDNKNKPIRLNVNVGGTKIEMELGIGASCSTVSETAYQALLNEFPLKEIDLTLCN